MTPADRQHRPELQRPSMGALPSYISALERGWSPDNIRARPRPDEQLERITRDAAAFLDTLHDPEAVARIKLPDGSAVPRLPGFTRWIWDGEFCGSIICAAKTAPRALHRTCSGTSATRSCRGSAAVLRDAGAALLLPEAAAGPRLCRADDRP